MGRYYVGLIVRTYYHDGHGTTKLRPAVVIDGGDDWEQTGEILVIPISATPDRATPSYHVQVHDQNQFDPVTGLNRPCWAKCNWASWIDVKRIQGKSGDLPDDLLNLIADAYDALIGDSGFNNWHPI